MEQTTQKTPKERQPMKKKPLILTIVVILALILIGSIIFIATNKNVNIKATRIDGVTSDLKDEKKDPENKYAQNKLFLESPEELEIFLSKFEGKDYVTNPPEGFEKYDENFFGKKCYLLLRVMEFPIICV